MYVRNVASQAEDERAPAWYLVVTGLIAFGVLFGVWTALVGSADTQEAIAGSVAAAIGTATGWIAVMHGRAAPRLVRGDFVDLARLLPRLFVESGQVLAAAFGWTRGGPRSSGYRSVATGVSGGGWAASRRSSVVTYVLSFTPNSVVVTLDDETGQATVHDFLGGDG